MEDIQAEHTYRKLYVSVLVALYCTFKNSSLLQLQDKVRK